MNLGKLQSAISPVAQKISDAMSVNVSVCQSLSPQNAEKSKTNPNPTGRRALAGRQLAAAGLLVEGSDVPEVAQRLDVSERTIFRWKKDPRFVQEVQRRAQEVKRKTNPAALKPTLPTRPQPPRIASPKIDLEAYIGKIKRGVI